MINILCKFLCDDDLHANENVSRQGRLDPQYIAPCLFSGSSKGKNMLHQF